MRLNEMMEFVDPYALPADWKKEELDIKSKSKASAHESKDFSGYYLPTSIQELHDMILPEWNAALLYIAKEGEIDLEPIIADISKEYGAFLNTFVLVVDDDRTLQT